MLMLRDVMGAIGTDPDAVSAETASHAIETQFPVRLVRLRILAPQATERAPLEEDRGPNARAVMRAEPLNIDDECR